MIKFYNVNQFDQWWQDFQNDTKLTIDIKHIDILQNWINNSSNSLSEFYEMKSCSINAECFILNNDVIVKSTKIDSALHLYGELLRHPDIKNYTMPTYVYTFLNNHSLNSEHIEFIKLKKCNHVLEHCAFSNCLILQPKCELFEKEIVFKKWLGEHTDLLELKEKYKLDFYAHNAGYFNNEVKFFDW